MDKIILVMSSHEISLRTLHQYLALKEQAQVEVMVPKALRQGSRVEMIFMDEVGPFDEAMHSVIRESHYEPVVAPDPTDKVPRSKGDKHRNRRFRWA